MSVQQVPVGGTYTLISNAQTETKADRIQLLSKQINKSIRQFNICSVFNVRGRRGRVGGKMNKHSIGLPFLR